MAVTSAVILTEPDFFIARWRAIAGQAITFFAQTCANIIDSQGPEAMRGYMATVLNGTDIRVGFFSDSGVELSGRLPPKGAWEFGSRIRSAGQTEFQTSLDRTLGALLVLAPGGSRYIMVCEIPRGTLFMRPVASRVFAVRCLFALLVAGLVCFALTRYLTAPVYCFRTLTREIASGNLGFRLTGSSLLNRGDELSELAADLNLMVARLEVLANSQRRLLADISHELRSPLTRLTAALDIANRKASPALLGDLARIGKESGRMNAMIHELLSLTRLESEPRPQESHVIDLAEIIGEVLNDAQFEANATNRRVVATLETDLYVTGVGRLLRSALDNVVRNAIRHTPENTEVLLTGRRELDGSVIVEVLDHGPGVPDSALQQIFEPFFR
ncbi:MAG: hypothetical protein H7Y20_03875, partial [Bryobacteraceae bacterium]|nr:hypothetical protein [Bryobacteraceae bacterium]